ncbi:50S ribosomal protein L5 [Candidatus Parcubacteria bacterium]|nr:MAG: 50S ribosomal protein L5 [Candidatus Parcubacteria bacterium]
MQKETSDRQSDQRKELRNTVEKIVVNAGVGRLSAQPNFEEKGLPQVVRDIALLAGQRPQVRRAKKSIAGFKIREGQVVGLSVILRRDRMVDFFARLIKIVLPRVRDFAGIDSHSVDKSGVLNIGLREQFVFPEVAPEESPISFSLGINVVPKLRSREAAIEAYARLGVPLKRSKERSS